MARPERKYAFLGNTLMSSYLQVAPDTVLSDVIKLNQIHSIILASDVCMGGIIKQVQKNQ